MKEAKLTLNFSSLEFWWIAPSCRALDDSGLAEHAWMAAKHKTSATRNEKRRLLNLAILTCYAILYCALFYKKVRPWDRLLFEPQAALGKKEKETERKKGREGAISFSLSQSICLYLCLSVLARPSPSITLLPHLSPSLSLSLFHLSKDLDGSEGPK